MKKRIIILWAAVILAMTGCGKKTTTGPIVETVEGTTEESQKGPQAVPGETTIAPFPTSEAETKEEPERNQKLVLATDIHYLAKSLTDGGSGFQYMVEHGDGKLANYVWEITDAFIGEVLEENPQALILSGDLSLNGERKSHEELAGKLRQVEDAGIQVVVIPGNHDINTVGAAAFIKNERIPTEKTSPEEFETIYGDFGYKEALSRDDHSLSYVYQLDELTRLLMLDTCQYDSGYAKVGGMIEPETYEWMKQQLDDAWNQGMNVIPVGHHNLLDQSQVYVSDCTIEHGEELEEVLSDGAVGMYISGHLHVQHYKSSEEYDIDEVVTASLSTAPCYYSVIEYEDVGAFSYRTKSVDMERWARQMGSEDEKLLNFSAYSNEFLKKVFFNQAYDSLKNKEIKEKDKKSMAQLYAELNAYAVAGTAMEKKEETLANPAYQLWQEYDNNNILYLYMEEILRDAVCDYNTFRRE